MSRSTLSVAARVLRDPRSLLEEAEDPKVFAALIPRLLGLTCAAAALFGVVVGSYRGGVQIPYVAIKMPLLLLIPLVVALPAVRALWAACGAEASYGRIALAGLLGVTRTAILAAALGPVLWLLYSSGLDYHLAVLVLVAALGVVGLPGLAVLGAVAPAGRSRRWIGTLGSALVFGILLAQSGWLLRPFVARPTVEVSFLRPIEAHVFSSLGASSSSAVGWYDGWRVERRGLLSRPEEEAP